MRDPIEQAPRVDLLVASIGGWSLLLLHWLLGPKREELLWAVRSLIRTKRIKRLSLVDSLQFEMMMDWIDLENVE